MKEWLVTLDRFKQGQPTTEDLRRLKSHLKQLGYQRDDDEEEGFGRALIGYQRFFEIKESGLGPLTLANLSLPRCLVADPAKGVSEERFAWNGQTIASCPWCEVRGTTVKYIFGFLKDPLFGSILDSAAKFWSDAGIVGLGRHTAGDVLIEWSTGPSGIFAVIGDFIANATLPCAAGNWHKIDFDIGELWSRSREAGMFNVFNVALHEFGHILGLGHSNRKKDLMYPLFSEAEDDRDLSSARDLTALVNLYGTRCPGGRAEKILVADVSSRHVGRIRRLIGRFRGVRWAEVGPAVVAQADDVDLDGLRP